MEIRPNLAKHQEIEKIGEKKTNREIFSPDIHDLPKIAGTGDISADAKSHIRQKSAFYKWVV